MLRRPALAALSLAFALTLAGCGGDPEPSADVPDPVRVPPSSAAPERSYVALGDSYTAAPLISSDPVTDGCLRSSVNYPALVAEELGYALTDVSCSGATTANLRTPQATTTGDVPPQLDALEEDTALVTIGLGGNDDSVFARLIGCATDQTSCRDRAGLEAAVDGLGDHLTDAIAAVRERAPQAEVVVVGYPQIIDADASCADRFPLPDAVRPFLAGLNERLHTVQQRAARAAEASYVDLYDASADHGVCADEPWVNGLETKPGVGLAVHPLAAGQAAAAELVLAAVG
ncbi:MAG TPA: SGNH/GDSL hydrolase family protein [Nocardioides sp.]|uniref:SGNH/GDSL hydrolase family protein n=1 Tax=Nocardioides sp. TaxID=35761 RepID=UPI002B8CE424|nr:SGNH/GDSL hydrolase family protein [Nocardioides sp.]HTW15959.1 SGNH/GDSL hydrolase family protein [Nocardioides sp.]